MPTSITVGNGHGAPDYATAQLAWDALSGSDQGGTVTAECLGDCGSTFTASGASSNPWVFQTQGVVYDGTNESSLAVMNRVSLQTAITVRNMMFKTGNAFVQSLIVNADNILAENFRLIQQGANVAGLSVSTALTGTSVNNFVRSGGLDGIASGFNDGTSVSNYINFGAADKGFEAAGSVGVQILTDGFSFNNGGADYDTGQLTINTCASEDGTGTYTGYTSAELVNFAGNDFRTKSTSALATLGSGGSFIGAFLEAGGGPTFQPAWIIKQVQNQLIGGL